jgi:imidazole glycerol-phosphate synthase subunit HisF
MRARVIPTLLVDHGGLVKTVKFKDQTYIGDPINAVRLFNDMEVDEIIVMDISATRSKRKPDTAFIHEFASESFMPFCYGGGVSSIEQMSELFNQGAEKVALNNILLHDRSLVGEAVKAFGSQSVVGCLDVKKDFMGRRRVYDYATKKGVPMSPETYAKQMEEEGVGEIFVYAVDRDGMMTGYDLDLIRKVCAGVNVPVIACGGAGTIRDLVEAKEAGAAAVAAGSMFVYQGKQKGVLINYPTQKELDSAFGPVPDQTLQFQERVL